MEPTQPQAPDPMQQKLEQARLRAASAKANPFFNPADNEPEPGELDLEYQDALSEFDIAQAKRILAELYRRQMETLRLYEPLPNQMAFHLCLAPERLVLGGNRGSKTTTGLMELGWIVSGTHPCIPYPKKDGRAIVVGHDGKHLSEVFFRKLCGTGAINIIQDEDTGSWRTYRPWTDKHRRAEIRRSPPIIPPRLFADPISFENKKERVPSLMRFRTGWEVRFFSANAWPPRGVDVDCLSGRSMVYDPVQRKYRRIDTIDGPWHVLSEDGVRQASRPFIKGYGTIYRITLTNGQQIETTLRHKLKARSGEWVTIESSLKNQIPLEAFSDHDASECHDGSVPAARKLEKCRTALRSGRYSIFRTAHAACRRSSRVAPLHWTQQGCGVECALRETRTTQGSQSHCWICSHLCGGHPPLAEVACQGASPSEVDALGRSRVSLHGGLAGKRARTRTYQHVETPVASCRCEQHLAVQSCESPLPWHAGLALPGDLQSQSVGRFLGSSCADQRTSCVQDRHLGRGEQASAIPQSSVDNVDVKVYSVEEIGQEPIWDIYVPGTHSYVYGGALSHNCVIFDEETGQEWYEEMAARLVDRAGRFFWMATPQTGTDQLLSLSEQAERMKNEGAANPRVVQFDLNLADNPYLDEEQKQLIADKYRDNPEAYRIRILGEFAAHGYKVYPEFSENIHGIRNQDLLKLYPETLGAPPANWARYMVVDPGHTICAVLFAAVPPDNSHVLLYDELYIPSCTSEKFAEHVYHKTLEQHFQAFIIDMHGSARTETGTGMTIYKHYSDALRRKGICSEKTKNGFIMSDDDVLAGCSKVRSWLLLQDNGKPYVRYAKEKMPNFTWEMKKYRKKVVKGVIQEEPEQRRNNHLCDTLRYLACYDPKWIKPKAPMRRKSAGRVRIEEKERKKRKKGEGGYVNLGPRQHAKA